MKVRALPLQPQKAPITLIINVLGAFLLVSGSLKSLSLLDQLALSFHNKVK